MLQAAMQATKLASVTRLEKHSHDVGGADEEHATAHASGLDAERDGEVRLSGANRARDDHVACTRDPFAAREVGELSGVDGAVGGDEVEAVERLHLREACLAQAMAHGGVAARDNLRRERVVQILFVAPVLLARLARESFEDAGEAGHLEHARLGDDQILGDGGAAHVSPRPRSAS